MCAPTRRPQPLLRRPPRPARRRAPPRPGRSAASWWRRLRRRRARFSSAARSAGGEFPSARRTSAPRSARSCRRPSRAGTAAWLSREGRRSPSTRPGGALFFTFTRALLSDRRPRCARNHHSQPTLPGQHMSILGGICPRTRARVSTTAPRPIHPCARSTRCSSAAGCRIYVCAAVRLIFFACCKARRGLCRRCRSAHPPQRPIRSPTSRRTRRDRVQRRGGARLRVLICLAEGAVHAAEAVRAHAAEGGTGTTRPALSSGTAPS